MFRNSNKNRKSIKLTQNLGTELKEESDDESDYYMRFALYLEEMEILEEKISQLEQNVIKPEN